MIYVVTEEILPILFPTCMTSASVNLIFKDFTVER
jgi:hypothetical protein